MIESWNLHQSLLADAHILFVGQNAHERAHGVIGVAQRESAGRTVGALANVIGMGFLIVFQKGEAIPHHLDIFLLS